MRNLLIIAVVSALAATPALGRGGPPAGVPARGGGMGAGRGAGPPITPPGQMGLGAGTSDFARGIGDQRGQFGRDFANQQRMTAQQYQALAEQHKRQALELAAAVRAGAPLPPHAAGRLRQAMQHDLQLWREQFQVGRQQWQAMRDQWLAERGTVSAQEWALRRAAWFAARDNWIAAQRAWAQSHGQ